MPHRYSFQVASSLRNAERMSLRNALLTHLETKGVLLPMQAEAYRAVLDATGTFPNLWLHSLLKTAPLPFHLAVVNDAYRRKAGRRIRRHAWRWPWRLASGLVLSAGKSARHACSKAVGKEQSW